MEHATAALNAGAQLALRAAGRSHRTFMEASCAMNAGGASLAQAKTWTRCSHRTAGVGRTRLGAWNACCERVRLRMPLHPEDVTEALCCTRLRPPPTPQRSASCFDIRPTRELSTVLATLLCTLRACAATTISPQSCRSLRCIQPALLSRTKTPLSPSTLRAEINSSVSRVRCNVKWREESENAGLRKECSRADGQSKW